ncbi:hypothetical protein cand_025920 [Cryptosporidium andersoni]|uniref:Uncharacterized protein n=1 Tax=Cryptosporidium andersoni TaxID=117008 RepID=A0A1J4MAC1_9CRYT|nr:hypothetical protein cand_025920 [Cryptosporidium andersoni]
MLSTIGDFFGECKRHEFNIIVTGPALSGKTALIMRLLKGKYVDPLTCINQSLCKVNVKDCNLILWDDVEVSALTDDSNRNLMNRTHSKHLHFGHSQMIDDMNKSRYWNIYREYNKYDFHGILFCVDSSDIGRIPLAKKLLSRLIVDSPSSSIAILILATKQDVVDAITPDQLAAELQVSDMVRLYGNSIREYAVVGISSYSGIGCVEALEWISNAIWQHQTCCYCLLTYKTIMGIANLTKSLIFR